MKIFIASTGRCGTLFATEIFNLLTDIPAYHEPRPECIGKVVEEINSHVKYSKATLQILNEKIDQIKGDSIRGKYMESNQMFVKCYADVVLNNFKDVYCIYLYRNPIAVLLSYAVKCQNHESGWFLRSHWPKNILQTEQKLGFYENCLWQWLEVRERYYSLKPKFKKTYEFDFRKINDLAEWYRLFRHFRIKARKVNRLPNLKRNPTFCDRYKTLDMVMDENDMATLPKKLRDMRGLWDYINLAKEVTERADY
ncbi:MAG: hypothetical protein GTO16_13805 [Candidatus Aminicenantes bacterium]|nr:hypothetical protein [Candidatus Aminicenantes bacterium]